jgi:hypothetical protein
VEQLGIVDRVEIFYGEGEEVGKYFFKEALHRPEPWGDLNHKRRAKI